MHHSWWSYNKTPTPRRRENPTFSREIELIDSYVWVPSTTLLCSIFLPVLVKAIPCIGKDLGMSTIAYASLMVELQQDGYTSKMRDCNFSREIELINSNVWVPTTTLLCSIFSFTSTRQLFMKDQVVSFGCLGVRNYLPVLYFPASACQSHPMYR